jgi:hypothetical protein
VGHLRQVPIPSTAHVIRVLNGAISDGTSNMNWSNETFAYADAHDGDTWVGVHPVEHVTPAPGGWLIEPAYVPARKTDNEDEADPGLGGDSGNGQVPIQPKPGKTVTNSKAFYTRFELDSVRGIKQLGEILEHVVARLGSEASLTLEIRSTNPDGYDDATKTCGVGERQEPWR